MIQMNWKTNEILSGLWCLGGDWAHCQWGNCETGRRGEQRRMKVNEDPISDIKQKMGPAVICGEADPPALLVVLEGKK